MCIYIEREMCVCISIYGVVPKSGALQKTNDVSTVSENRGKPGLWSKCLGWASIGMDWAPFGMDWEQL